MRDDPWQSFGRRRLVVFAAAFAGVLLLGGLVGAIEFLELRSSQTPAAVPAVVRILAAPPVARSEFDAKVRDALAQVGDTRRTAEAAEVAVFQFLNQEFVERAQELERPVRAPTVEPRRAAIQSAKRPNPEWLRLNGELASLQSKRRELLQKMTPAHPAVKAVDGQIGELEDQIAAIPAELTSEPDQNARSQANVQVEAADGGILNSETTSNVGSNAKQSAIELQAKYRTLLLAAGHARDAYHTALDGEKFAFDECIAVPKVHFASNRGTIHLSDRHSEYADSTSFERKVPVCAIAILALVSLIAGSAAARCVSPRKLTYISAEEIEAAFGLPILGRIGTHPDKSGKDAA